MASSAYAATILAESGLVSNWRLGESAGTSAADSKGTNTGTYKASPTLAQTGALALDSNTSVLFATASKQYVAVPDANSLDLGDTFTYEIWFKRTRTGSTESLIDKGPNAAILRFDGEDRILLRRNSVGDIVKTSVKVTDTNWHHVVATKSGATVKLYLDGIDVTGTVTNQTCTNNATALSFGASEAGGEDWFSGNLDEVALYNVALTKTQAVDHYRKGTGRTQIPGQGSETDSARPLGITKTIRKTLSPAAETASAQALVRSKLLVPGRAAETSSAQARSITKRVTPGSAVETNAARALSLRKSLGLVPASESDAARPVALSKRRALTPAAEVDAANAAAWLKRLGLAAAGEVGAALALGIGKRRTMVPAIETDAAVRSALSRRVVLAVAAEAASASSLSLRRLVSLGTAEEHGEAQKLSYRNLYGPISLTPAQEASQAHGLSFVKPIHVVLTPGLEADQARLLDFRKTIVVSVSPATEADVAMSPGLRHRIALGQALEVSDAVALGLRKVRLFGQAAEQGIAWPISPQRRIWLAPGQELDAVLPLILVAAPGEVQIALSLERVTSLELWVEAATRLALGVEPATSLALSAEPATRLALSVVPAVDLDLEV